jgi:hypothetical protein
MSGVRLVTGILVMGVAVPGVLFLFLGLNSVSALFTVAATCFVGWGVTDLVGNILSRPRLRDRTPTGAIRDWEQQRSSEAPNRDAEPR